jgi:hypothetical protein
LLANGSSTCDIKSPLAKRCTFSLSSQSGNIVTGIAQAVTDTSSKVYITDCLIQSALSDTLSIAVQSGQTSGASITLRGGTIDMLGATNSLNAQSATSLTIAGTIFTEAGGLSSKSTLNFNYITFLGQPQFIYQVGAANVAGLLSTPPYWVGWSTMPANSNPVFAVPAPRWLICSDFVVTVGVAPAAGTTSLITPAIGTSYAAGSSAQWNAFAFTTATTVYNTATTFVMAPGSLISVWVQRPVGSGQSAGHVSAALSCY